MAPPPARTIAVVDDHPLIAKALAELIRLRGHTTVEHASFSAFLAWLEEAGRPDLCIIDYRLPDVPGDEIISRVHQTRPDLPVAIWSGSEDAGLPLRMIEKGAVGFLSKAVPISVIPPALELLLEGQMLVSTPGRHSLILEGPQLNAQADDDGGGGPDGGPDCRGDTLTPREREVMHLLLQGLSNKEIAARLKLDPVTVKMHCRHIYRKLRARNRTEASLHFLGHDSSE